MGIKVILPSCDRIRRQLVRRWTLESDDRFRLVLAVVDVVGVVADVVLRVVRQARGARSLISYTSGTLK